MTIDAAAVTEVLDLIEREVMKGLVRDAMHRGADNDEVALVVELAAETLRIRRPVYLDLTSMWIESQLSTSH